VGHHQCKVVVVVWQSCELVVGVSSCLGGDAARMAVGNLAVLCETMYAARMVVGFSPRGGFGPFGPTSYMLR